MKKVPFKSGIHPKENKEYSMNEKIKIIASDKIAVFPMSQHIGAPATPVVSVGDQVAKGQLIGEPKDGLSVAIHCSIDGVVQKVTDREVVVKGK